MRRTVPTAPVSSRSARVGQRGGRLAVGAGEVAHLPELQRHGGQHRAEVVVQVAAQPAALLLAGRTSRSRDRCSAPRSWTAWAATATWPGQVVEQPQVAGRQRPAGPADQPHADHLAGVHQRHLHASPPGRPLVVTGPSATSTTTQGSCSALATASATPASAPGPTASAALSSSCRPSRTSAR